MASFEQKLAAGRMMCCVPGCKRTRKPDDGEWICGPHWKMVSKSKRRRVSFIVRRYEKRFGREPFWKFAAGSEKRIEAARIHYAWVKAWNICKKQAIERAMGI